MKKQKTKYTAKELKEFKTIIENKLSFAREELLDSRQAIEGNPNDGEHRPLVLFESGNESSLKEEALKRIERATKTIEELEKALLRIEKGSYGICITSGQLIAAERLKANPTSLRIIAAQKIQENLNA